MDKDLSTMLADIPDEVLQAVAFSAPWQYGGEEVHVGMRKDIDGAPYEEGEDFRTLQALCYKKFETNPQVFTAILDMVGRLTGEGFEMSSSVFEIDEFINRVYKDPRNRLPLMMPKYALRAKSEGELFLVLTVHPDGFVEIDFREPSTVRGIGFDGSGIVFHPKKAHIPILYQFEEAVGGKTKFTAKKELIPSIFVARYPDLLDIIKNDKDYFKDVDLTLLEANKPTNIHAKKYEKVGGFQRFVIQWDMGTIKTRNVSQVRTTLKWVNYYENLKQYEIDHKKSSGSYLWTITFDDVKAFRTWLGMTDEERRKTGIMAKKTPGGTILLPPGMKMEVHNPTLPNISGADTDILQMVVSGLNTPEDMVTGSNQGTFASVKASRGPMSDRVSNEISYFRTFLKYDFWDSIFFLASQLSSFKYTYPIRKCTGFKKQKEVFKTVKVNACELVDFNFPTSEVGDLEARTRALLGVKHGSLNSVMGIPNAALAKRLGIGNYHKARLDAATEADMYPELEPDVDQDASTQEGAQEKVKGSGEKKKNKTKKDDGED